MTLRIALACGLLLAAVADAPASATVRCASADLRYAFVPGGPDAFGVFGLKVSGAGCATARRVAKAWMVRFEAGVDAGRSEPPRLVERFRFETLPVQASQTYRQRGRRGATTIRFDYRIPNG